MKKIIMLLAGIAIIHAGNAQVTLPASLVYAVGDAYLLQPATPNGSLPSAAGANVTIDLSSIAATGDAVMQTFTTAAATPYASSFPGANLASASEQAGYTTYYNATANAIELLGIGTDNYTVVYSNPMKIVSYPVSYGDSTYDEYTAAYSVNGIDAMRSGHVYRVADAYGTIKTPTGSFAYLRLKTTQVIVDSFYQGGTFVDVSEIHNTTYEYMNNQIKVAVLSYSELSTEQGDRSSAYYYVGTHTGINEQVAAPESASLFPNPAQGRLSVNLPANAMASAQLCVYDMQGRLMQVPVAASGESHNQMSLDISSLAPGVYSLQIGSGSSSRTMKFVIK